jgi:hypothetical protein
LIKKNSEELNFKKIEIKAKNMSTELKNVAQYWNSNILKYWCWFDFKPTDEDFEAKSFFLKKDLAVIKLYRIDTELSSKTKTKLNMELAKNIVAE